MIVIGFVNLRLFLQAGMVLKKGMFDNDSDTARFFHVR